MTDVAQHVEHLQPIEANTTEAEHGHTLQQKEDIVTLPVVHTPDPSQGISTFKPLSNEITQDPVAQDENPPAPAPIDHHPQFHPVLEPIADPEHERSSSHDLESTDADWSDIATNVENTPISAFPTAATHSNDSHTLPLFSSLGHYAEEDGSQSAVNHTSALFSDLDHSQPRLEHDEEHNHLDHPESQPQSSPRHSQDLLRPHLPIIITNSPTASNTSAAPSSALDDDSALPTTAMTDDRAYQGTSHALQSAYPLSARSDLTEDLELAVARETTDATPLHSPAAAGPDQIGISSHPEQRQTTLTHLATGGSELHPNLFTPDMPDTAVSHDSQWLTSTANTPVSTVSATADETTDDFESMLAGSSHHTIDKDTVTANADPKDSSFEAMLAHPDTTDLPTPQLVREPNPAHNTAAMWEAALGDDDDFLDDSTSSTAAFAKMLADDDGFLDDMQTSASAPSAEPAKNRYLPSTLPQQQSSNVPAAFQSNPLFISSASPPTAPALPRQPTQAPSALQNLNLHRPLLPGNSKSFVDQAKSGYASPYDLPEDIVQTRKRPLRQASQPVQSSVVPPPRVSSATSHPLPAVTSVPGSTRPTPPPGNSAAFFEDLPVETRPRTRSSGASLVGRQAGLSLNHPLPPMPLPTHLNNVIHPHMPPSSTLQAQQTPQGYAGMQQPGRMPAIPDQPEHAPLGQGQAHSTSTYGPKSVTFQPRSATDPVQNQYAQRPTRYSPAPQAEAQHQPPVQRYASPPLSGPAQRPLFVPRVSSPLADPVQNRFADPTLNMQRHGRSTPQMPPRHASPPVNTYTPGAMNLPLRPGMPPAANTFAAPPSRVNTQSPGQQREIAPLVVPKAPRSIAVIYDDQYKATPQRRVSQSVNMSHRRKFSADLTFARPQDERAHDSLERWQGHPIFRWSKNGTVLTSFPKQTPFYTAGQNIPTIKCTAGSVSVHTDKLFFPLEPCNAKFPGPLNTKAKGKKKEVVQWLSDKIDELENSLQQSVLGMTLPLPLKVRGEEKIILWKAVKLLIEQDSVFDGKHAVAEAARTILVGAPNQAELKSPTGLPEDDTALPINSVETLVEIRQLLSQGRREDAVWYAIERKSWAHAMLIGSTLDPSVWKQITQEFVKAQVKGKGEESEALAALYEVFAGNWEECIDALVPPSARAGLQMMSRRQSVIVGSRDPLEGLDQWRSTLSLILSNRSKNDGQAIAALGRLLAGYGRIEAAHTCFVFARAFVTHSGRDDPNASFVLLGVDHKSDAIGIGADLDAILLTEILEFSLTLAHTPGTSPIVPHLQNYKLLHAYELAEHGMRNEAQSYCDAIAAAIKSTTKPSPYYHPAFMTLLEDFSRCLSQSPQTGATSGWVSKLSSDKVSGSMWKRFNTFVSGEEVDQAANDTTDMPGMGPSPFARVTGDTPSVSRTPSNTDLYGVMGGQTIPSLSTSPTKYGPLAFSPIRPDHGVDPRSSPMQSFTSHPAELERSVSMQPHQYAPSHVPRLSGSGQYASQAQQVMNKGPLSKVYAARPEAHRAASDYHVPYDHVPSMSPVSGMYHVNDEPSSAPATRPASPPAATPMSSAYQPMSAMSYNPYSPDDLTEGPTSGMTAHSNHTFAESIPSSAATSHLEAVSAASYQPTSFEPSNFDVATPSFEPPTFEPYVPEPDVEDAESQDNSPHYHSACAHNTFSPSDFDRSDTVPQSQPSSAKAAADKEADDAFRKAAEADAARSKVDEEAKAKKGWIPGWLRGGGAAKDKDATPGPIRAKLGEESAFYFDKELNKWVNKKGGTEQVASTPFAPPPRSGSAKSVMGPPSGPPSRPGSGQVPTLGAPAQFTSFGQFPPSALASGSSTRAGTPGVGLDPPSRPGTSLSTASSIDDLLAGPPGRKGAAKPKKRAGRYVDVMAK